MAIRGNGTQQMQATGGCSVRVHIDTSSAKHNNDKSLSPMPHDGPAKPRISWGKILLPGAALLTLPLLLVSVLLAITLATLWLLSGAHCLAYAVLLRRGELSALTQEVDVRGPVHRLMAVYMSFIMFAIHMLWRAGLKHLIRPAFVFVVYPDDERALNKIMSTVCFRAVGVMGVHMPQVAPIGLILSRAGLGVCAGAIPCMSNLSDEQAKLVTQAVQATFPYTKAFALAGRLPSLLARLKVPVEPPFVDGVHGTIFTMVAAAEALQKCTQRPVHDTRIVVLGGGGFIGSRLVQMLHLKQHQPGGGSSGYKQVIALDKRYKTEYTQGGILYTSEESAITAADVVLVITARGNDCAAYLPYARAGQVWGDDTHPEMGRKVVQGLLERGVTLLKVFNTGGVGARFVPRLPGFPAHSIPGCLLMALTQVQHGWQLGQEGGDEAASYEAFRAAAAKLGFTAGLCKHASWFE